MRVVREIVLEDTDCCVCAVTFAVPVDLLIRRRQDGQNFYCPNGHSLAFNNSENRRLRKQVEALQAQLTAANDQRQAAERAATTARGEATKLRKRVANGVCPCCRRSFVNLARHMAGQHPDFAGGAS